MALEKNSVAGRPGSLEFSNAWPEEGQILWRLILDEAPEKIMVYIWGFPYTHGSTPNSWIVYLFRLFHGKSDLKWMINGVASLSFRPPYGAWSNKHRWFHRHNEDIMGCLTINMIFGCVKAGEFSPQHPANFREDDEKSLDSIGKCVKHHHHHFSQWYCRGSSPKRWNGFQLWEATRWMVAQSYHW